MKIGEQKVQRTLRKQKVRGLLQDKKVPGTSIGTRAAASPGLPLPGLLQDSWERAGLTAPPLPNKAWAAQRDTWLIEVRGRGIRTKCGKHRKTVGAGWGDLRIGPYEVLTMAVSGLAGEVGCVRGQALPCTERQD